MITIDFWEWAVWKYGIHTSSQITYGMMKEFAEKDWKDLYLLNNKDETSNIEK